MNIDKTTDHIRDIVRDLISSEEMFTAYDVTKLFRRKVKGMFRHGDLKNQIHGVLEEEMHGKPYMRSLIEVGQPIQPWLYHPVDKDRNDYDPRRVDNQKKTKAIRSAGRFMRFGRFGSAPKAAPQPQKNGCRRERLYVSPKHLKQIGLGPGTRAYISAHGTGLAIFTRRRKNHFASYVVEKNGSIRISKKVANLGGVTKEPSFHILLDCVLIY